MAFQAGGPHAQDRALEAIAYAYAEMTRHAARGRLGEAAGQAAAAADDEDVHRGAARRRAGDRLQHLPDLELLPGPVRLAWSPATRSSSSRTRGAVLPLAHHRADRPRGARRGRLRPRTWCTLAAEQPGEGLAKMLALRPEVRIIDFTGSTGVRRLAGAATPARRSVFTEKAGVNTVVIDSTDDYRGMLANLAFSLSLYSGQMCTTPQNLLVPRDGITTDGGPQVGRRGGGRPRGRGRRAARRRRARDGAARRGGQRRGARAAREGAGRTARSCSRPATVTHPDFPDAVVRTPTLVKARRRPTATPTCRSASARSRSSSPPTAPAESIDLLRESVRDHGRHHRGRLLDRRRRCSTRPRRRPSTPASRCRRTSPAVYVNQSAAFSDFHATGANPAANAALTDAAYVASRFRIVQSRRHLPAGPA